MALKDWKKMKTMDYHYANYFNADTSDSLSIRKVGDGTTNVEVFNDKSGEDKVVRNFKTKAEAMAYAESYMRKN